jgi:prevent-host-death family protein
MVMAMSTVSTMSLADAKAHLSELVNRVQSEHDRVTLTVHGKPSAVLISQEELESLQETIAVLSDQPLVQQLLASESEIAQGQGETLEQLSAAMQVRKRNSRVT